MTCGLTADEIIALLGLVPHPEEGGHFHETYRSTFATAIHYLLTPATISHMHRLASDEVFHFYLGDPVEMLHLHPDGSGSRMVLGTDLAAGMRPQIVVKRGVWQGARLATGGRRALMGCTVAPAFEYADYDHGHRAALIAAYPAFRTDIEALTVAPP